jgi:uncharacterized metal-binding protein
MRCDLCKEKPCTEGNPCVPKESRSLYLDPESARILAVGAEVEAKYYGMLCRLDEILEFSRRLGVSRIGLAFCVGLAEEAAVVGEIFAREFTLHSVCCKVGGISKKELGVVGAPWLGEASCNPAQQAKVLAEADCELAVLLGLCVGHDMLFHKNWTRPVTTLAVKDRKLGHNPLAAIYCPYLRKHLGKKPRERTEADFS